MSRPLTRVASFHSRATVWTVVDLVTDLQSAYSSAGMTDYVFAAIGCVPHSSAVHAADLCAGVTAGTCHVSELTAVVALQYRTRVLKVPPIRLELLHEIILSDRFRLYHLLRSPLYAK